MTKKIYWGIIININKGMAGEKLQKTPKSYLQVCKCMNSIKEQRSLSTLERERE